jgi:hypothetical protein
MTDEERHTMISTGAKAFNMSTRDIMLSLWTAHASGDYEKAKHKPLWLELQRRVSAQ